MVPLALRTLLFDKIRLFIAVAGIAFAILLILTLRGIMDGTVARSTTYIDHAGADVFVAQSGVKHFALSTSLLPLSDKQVAAAVPGVKEVAAIVTVPSVVALRGSEKAVRIVGIDPDSTVGAPWNIVEGAKTPSPGGVIVDEVLADEQGVSVGDRVTIAGQTLTVEGLSAQTNTIAGSLIFMQRQTASDILGLSDVASYLLVQAQPQANVDDVAAGLADALPDSSVLTRNQLSSNERSLLGGLFVTPVNVMSTIGLLVGLMVVVLTTYTATAERLRDFGVLKAIGASNAYLYLVVIRQALLFGLAGYVVGGLAAIGARYLVEKAEPSLGVSLHPVYALEILGLALVLSLGSSLVPVFRISSLDPKEVFQR